MSASDPQDAREAFRQSAMGYWAEVRAGDAKSADLQTAAGDVIVATWRRDGRLAELLGPLLQDPSQEVRYAAAAHLLGTELTGHAVSVLEALQSDPRGLLASTARLRLMTWRRESVT
jgi:hypothetical protein